MERDERRAEKKGEEIIEIYKKLIYFMSIFVYFPLLSLLPLHPKHIPQNYIRFSS
jgi:hypothetical protein